jgi:predicted hydrolase (HD superfamily)
MRPGKARLGPHDEAIIKHLLANVDLDRLEWLLHQVTRVSSWSELLLNRREESSGLHESSTYQEILEEGAKKEIRKLIGNHGEFRFGPANKAITAQLLAVTELSQLQ